MIDACKVEHLISAEARSRLVYFLQMLFSEKPGTVYSSSSSARQRSIPA